MHHWLRGMDAPVGRFILLKLEISNSRIPMSSLGVISKQGLSAEEIRRTKVFDHRPDEGLWKEYSLFCTEFCFTVRIIPQTHAILTFIARIEPVWNYSAVSIRLLLCAIGQSIYKSLPYQIGYIRLTKTRSNLYVSVYFRCSKFRYWVCQGKIRLQSRFRKWSRNLIAGQISTRILHEENELYPV